MTAPNVLTMEDFLADVRQRMFDAMGMTMRVADDGTVSLEWVAEEECRLDWSAGFPYALTQAVLRAPAGWYPEPPHFRSAWL